MVRAEGFVWETQKKQIDRKYQFISMFKETNDVDGAWTNPFKTYYMDIIIIVVYIYIYIQNRNLPKIGVKFWKKMKPPPSYKYYKYFQHRKKKHQLLGHP